LFSLALKVEGFSSTDNSGRKAYTKGRVIKWDVEVGSFSFDLLMNSLRNEFQWSSSQSASVWFYDKRMGEDVKLENDLQMHDIFEMYKDQMQCDFIVGVFDSCHRQAYEFDALEPLCVIPPVYFGDDNPDQIPPNSKDMPAGLGNDAADPIDHNSGEAEFLPIDPDPELEADREPDIFDNGEEYVGVDDEVQFMPVPSPQAANNSAPESSNNAEYPSFHDADEFDGVPNAEGETPPEAEVNDADPEEVQVIHDPENPKIEVGERFPDIVAFRKAVRHYAVLTGFEFAKVITDQTMFIAKCKAEGCPWRIHASRISHGKTIEVNCPCILYSCFALSYHKLLIIFFLICRSKYCLQSTIVQLLN